MRLIARRVSANVIPGRFGSHEQVKLDLHTRITIHTSKRHAMDVFSQQAAQRRAATAAETDGIASATLIPRQLARSGPAEDAAGREFDPLLLGERPFLIAEADDAPLNTLRQREQ